MNLSVAVLPPALRFSPSETKQILTLFNANDEPVKYKVSYRKFRERLLVLDALYVERWVSNKSVKR